MWNIIRGLHISISRPNSWINPTWIHLENGQHNFYSFCMFCRSSTSYMYEKFLCILSFLLVLSFLLLLRSCRGGRQKNWNNFYITEHDVKYFLSSLSFHTGFIVWRWFQWEKAHVSLSHFHFYHFFLPRILPNYRLPEAKHKLLSTGLSPVFLRRFNISLFRRHRARSRRCIKLKAFNTSPPRLMPSFFSYVLWLEYVFKHALLCRHKIYIITRQEQILFFQVRGRKYYVHLIFQHSSLLQSF